MKFRTFTACRVLRSMTSTSKSVRQMMRKVEIDDSGRYRFLESKLLTRSNLEENDNIWGKMVVVDAGDSKSLRVQVDHPWSSFRDENSQLKRRTQTGCCPEAVPATSSQVLQVTGVALQTNSFMSAASFQENNKGTNEAVIRQG